MKERDEDDAVWKALADPTRRQLLDLLRESPMTTGTLAERFDTTRFAVMKHLKVLVAAGLVLVERRGRERWNVLNPVPIQQVYRRWIRPFEAETADGLLKLKRCVEAQVAEKQKQKEKASDE
ncbi:MAG: metalloregulator ArsR/SmtB family transcription factor [Acidobacteriota bacterium]